MKLRVKGQNVSIFILGVILVGLIFATVLKTTSVSAEDVASSEANSENFITIYDSGAKTTLRSDARTVADVLTRANISTLEADVVEPTLSTEITSSPNFIINIYRAHPVVIVDGLERKKFLTAYSDPESVARAADIAIYDGDEISLEVSSSSLLETGVLTEYRITRNGGKTITIEEEIPFATRNREDSTLAQGTQRTVTIGEVGRKTLTYKVDFIDGVEARRTLTSEIISAHPVDQVVAIGTKPPANASTPNFAPISGSHEDWMRAAGIAESDFPYVNFIISHESGWGHLKYNYAGSGAYGLCQALPGSKMASAGADWKTNPITQLRWCNGYAHSRYGSWAAAHAFWLKKHWW